MDQPKREITDMQIEEVSIVDAPANKQPFLFFKDADGVMNAEKKLENPVTIMINTDGTQENTKIMVNDEEMKEIDSFYFSYLKPRADMMDGSCIQCSYSKVVEEDGGFQRIENYWLAKNAVVKADEKEMDPDDMMMKIKEACDVIKNYEEDFPTDLKDAIEFIKSCANGTIKPKKEAEENIETPEAEVTKENVSVENSPNVVKAEEVENVSKSEESNDVVLKALAGITDSINSLKDAVNKGQEVVEGIDSRLSKVEKSSNGRQSIEGQDNVEKSNYKFPSMLKAEKHMK